MTEINTHDLFVDFGKHEGERWTRIPIGYLKWLANQGEGENAEIAKAELDRRGITTPHSLKLSGHAIDRASQITKSWKNRGVYSWLQLIGEEALKQAKGKESIFYKGYKFVFAYGRYYPVLKTITKKG